MTVTTRTRIAVASSAAALCLGIAIPAAAHDAGATQHRPGADQHRKPTLAEAKAHATAVLDREAARMTKARAAVVADDDLSDAQKAAWTAKIDKALAAVASAKSAVADATTVAEVVDAERSARTRIALPHPDHPTLAQQKQWATEHLDAVAARLTAAKAKVAADGDLTSAQKAAYTARIDKALASIAAAKTAVAAATTDKQLHAALAAVRGSAGHYPRHARHATPATTTADRPAARVAAPKVTLASATTTTPRTRSLRVDPAGANSGRDLAGRHRSGSDHHGSRDHDGSRDRQRHGGFGHHR